MPLVLIDKSTALTPDQVQQLLGFTTDSRFWEWFVFIVVIVIGLSGVGGGIYMLFTAKKMRA
jgi:hypothetical protein